MSDRENKEHERDGGPSESEPNPTQQRMDELGESESDQPADVEWTDDEGAAAGYGGEAEGGAGNEPSPHEGEEGTQPA